MISPAAICPGDIRSSEEMMGIRLWALSTVATAALLSAAYSVHADGPATAPSDVINPLLAATTQLLGTASATPAATTMPTTHPASILLPSGVMITDTHAGGGAQSGDTVYVLYTGRIQNTGVEFDSSYDRHPPEPMRVTLGSGGVILGFWEGIIGMQIGDKRTIDIPAEAAYGPNPPPGSKIPPNAALEFDIELVGIARPLPATAK